MLGPTDAGRIARVRAWNRVLLVVGAALLLAGGLYGVWAADRLVNTPAADEATAFDRPIATIGVMLELQSAFTRFAAETARERLLLEMLAFQTDATARFMLFIARFFVSSALMTLGVALLMTAFAQHRLLRLIDRLTAAG